MAKKRPGSKEGSRVKLEDVNMDAVEWMTKRGATNAEIAKVLNISPRTLDYWREKNPELKEKIQSWKDEADENVVKSLYQRATGYSCKETKLFCHEGMIVSEEIVKNYPPDTTACIFWLKNRDQKNWRDKQEIEQTNTNMTVEEFLKLQGEK